MSVLVPQAPSINFHVMKDTALNLQNSTDNELKKQLAKAFEDKHKNEIASKVLD